MLGFKSFFYCAPLFKLAPRLVVVRVFCFASGGSLLSASDKSNQKRLSAHFAISNNTSLCSVLAKFEAEPNLF
ncbi:hypothetical protein II582_01995 [bacterium]|nr:hypothetical protein [bacterium]